MAESFIFSIAENLLGKLLSPVYQEIYLAWGLKTDLEKLKDTLSSIKSVLLDAEEQQVHSHEIRNWLEKLKDGCYWMCSRLKHYEGKLLLVKALEERMGHKIKKIMVRFDEIAATKAKFNLTVRVDNRQVVPREREMTHSFVIPSEIIGRDKDKEEIIQTLIDASNDETLSVIPIVGIGGLGKTALAKLVFNNERVDKHFELKMWVCVSEDFDLKQLIVKILKSVPETNENYTNLEVEKLQIILRETLDGKRYLLVLDDVWIEDSRKWIELKNLLSTGAKGSKILITTRSNKIASIMSAMKGVSDPYKLEGLSEKSCLSLLLKYAFIEGQENQYPNLIKIGEEIVKKCGGIPLAVTTLGSLLSSSTDEHDWRYVRDNEIWSLDQNGILPALRLSYDHLPSYLQQCFLYCSLFPKDYQSINFELIQFWMAHGLLFSPDINQDFENVGMRYLKELESRSFFQDFEQEGFYYTFKIHDLMHDLATSLMKSECLIVKSSDQHFSKSIRHLSFIDNDVRKTDFSSFLSEVDHIRSINFFQIEEDEARKSYLESCISRFQLLRLLNLENAGITVLPNKIGNLKHLRYLNLGGNNEIKKLPNSICKLQSLQTLILAGCEELKELPRDIRYLINLRLFWFTTKQMFLSKNSIGCLKSLRFLGIFYCKELEYLSEDIGSLEVLQTLLISGCPNLISLPPGIKFLSSLEILMLARCEKLNLDLMGTDGEDNHQDLNIPRLHLRFLLIAELPEVVELPQWLLQVSGNTLQTLPIAGCSNFKALPESMQDFKSLQHLHIMGCPELSLLPKDMNCLTAMRELKIHDCRALSEKCRPETGENWSQIAHIPKILLDGEIIKSSKN